MVTLSVSKLNIPYSDLIITILKEHEEKFSIKKGLESAFGCPVAMQILGKPTRSQSETVARTLELTSLKEPFFVKDSDNIFSANSLGEEYNYVCVESLNNFDSINPRNKSYLQIGHNDMIVNIKEKTVISDLFSVGGYYFCDPAQFMEFYYKLSDKKQEWDREIYISDVIGAMILGGIPFRIKRVSEYQDWGTVHEWRNALMSRKTYFVFLDGFVFQRGSMYFHPTFKDVQVIPEVVEVLKKIADNGHRIIYLSIRPQILATITKEQIIDAGLPIGQIVFDVPFGQSIFVTSPDPCMPFQVGKALELEPRDIHLEEKLRAI
jgi:hypothetical protein